MVHIDQILNCLQHLDRRVGIEKDLLCIIVYYPAAVTPHQRFENQIILIQVNSIGGDTAGIECGRISRIAVAIFGQFFRYFHKFIPRPRIFCPCGWIGQSRLVEQVLVVKQHRDFIRHACRDHLAVFVHKFDHV